MSNLFDNRISLGNILTVITGVVAVGVIVGTLQADVRALAQRLDTSEKKAEMLERRDDKTADTVDQMKGVVLELKGEQRAMKNDIERQGKQLDRIEQLLREQRGPLRNELKE